MQAQVLSLKSYSSPCSKCRRPRAVPCAAAQQQSKAAFVSQRNKLKQAKFTDQQAEALLEVTEQVGPDLVTKQDLKIVKWETRAEFAVLLFFVLMGLPAESSVGKMLAELKKFASSG